MSEMTDVLGRVGEAQHYCSLLERINAAFCEASLGEDGLLKGRTQNTQLLALHFDLVS